MSKASANSASAVVARWKSGSACNSAASLWWKCSLSGRTCKPKKSFHCPTQMITPIPVVNPTITGSGMYLMTAPKRASPIANSITPAIRVAICKPTTPYLAVMPERITMNAPVGPEICNRLPPNAEVKNPATMAVYSPCSGLAPEAMANAMASGKATTPTTRPAAMLLDQCPRRNNPALAASRRAIMAMEKRRKG